MFIYANQQEVKESRYWCEGILHNVQELLRNYFTFEIRLIGSGEKRLITQNGENGAFDLDYNLIIQRDKKNLINNPKQVKEIFISAFNEVAPNFEFSFAKNSTSVITEKYIPKDANFSFDIAIITQGNDDKYYKLIYDKPTNRYFWNEVPLSKNYQTKFTQLKRQGDWLTFKQRYLELKNMHLMRNESVPSFSVFLETLNEWK